MTIKILTDMVEIDGIRYKRVDNDEMWGIKEIATYLGHVHNNGQPNVNNLYKDTENENIKFPNFEKYKAMGRRKPWTKKEVIDWLSIPVRDRKAMYREYKNSMA